MKKFDPETPFNELPNLPPGINLETPRILKACIEANKELAKLKTAERLIPNQTVLINSIPLLESQASSAIDVLGNERNPSIQASTLSGIYITERTSFEYLGDLQYMLNNKAY